MKGEHALLVDPAELVLAEQLDEFGVGEVFEPLVERGDLSDRVPRIHGYDFFASLR